MELRVSDCGAAPTPDDVTHAFWGACHGGRLQCARYLIERGADLNWIPPWQTLSPVDAAERERADELCGGCAHGVPNPRSS